MTTVRMRLSVMGHSRGDLVEVDDGTAQRWIRGRFAESAGDDDAGGVVEAVEEETVTGVEPPTVGSKKDEWIDYADQVGVDTDGLTKQEIIDAVTDLESPVVYYGDE